MKFSSGPRKTYATLFSRYLATKITENGRYSPRPWRTYPKGGLQQVRHGSSQKHLRIATTCLALTIMGLFICQFGTVAYVLRVEDSRTPVAADMTGVTDFLQLNHSAIVALPINENGEHYARFNATGPCYLFTEVGDVDSPYGAEGAVINIGAERDLDWGRRDYDLRPGANTIPLLWDPKEDTYNLTISLTCAESLRMLCIQPVIPDAGVGEVNVTASQPPFQRVFQAGGYQTLLFDGRTMNFTTLQLAVDPGTDRELLLKGTSPTEAVNDNCRMVSQALFGSEYLQFSIHLDPGTHELLVQGEGTFNYQWVHTYGQFDDDLLGDVDEALIEGPGSDADMLMANLYGIQQDQQPDITWEQFLEQPQDYWLDGQISFQVPGSWGAFYGQVEFPLDAWALVTQGVYCNLTIDGGKVETANPYQVGFWSDSNQPTIITHTDGTREQVRLCDLLANTPIYLGELAPATHTLTYKYRYDPFETPEITVLVADTPVLIVRRDQIAPPGHDQDADGLPDQYDPSPASLVYERNTLMQLVLPVNKLGAEDAIIEIRVNPPQDPYDFTNTSLQWRSDPVTGEPIRVAIEPALVLYGPGDAQRDTQLDWWDIEGGKDYWDSLPELANFLGLPVRSYCLPAIDGTGTTHLNYATKTITYSGECDPLPLPGYENAYDYFTLVKAQRASDSWLFQIDYSRDNPALADSVLDLRFMMVFLAQECDDEGNPTALLGWYPVESDLLIQSITGRLVEAGSFVLGAPDSYTSRKLLEMYCQRENVPISMAGTPYAPGKAGMSNYLRSMILGEGFDHRYLSSYYYSPENISSYSLAEAATYAYQQSYYNWTQDFLDVPGGRIPQGWADLVTRSPGSSTFVKVHSQLGTRNGVLQLYDQGGQGLSGQAQVATPIALLRKGTIQTVITLSGGEGLAFSALHKEASGINPMATFFINGGKLWSGNPEYPLQATQILPSLLPEHYYTLDFAYDIDYPFDTNGDGKNDGAFNLTIDGQRRCTNWGLINGTVPNQLRFWTKDISTPACSVYVDGVRIWAPRADRVDKDACVTFYSVTERTVDYTWKINQSIHYDLSGGQEQQYLFYPGNTLASLTPGSALPVPGYGWQDVSGDVIVEKNIHAHANVLRFIGDSQGTATRNFGTLVDDGTLTFWFALEKDWDKVAPPATFHANFDVLDNQGIVALKLRINEGMLQYLNATQSNPIGEWVDLTDVWGNGTDWFSVQMTINREERSADIIIGGVGHGAGRNVSLLGNTRDFSLLQVSASEADLYFDAPVLLPRITPENQDQFELARILSWEDVHQGDTRLRHAWSIVGHQSMSTSFNDMDLQEEDTILYTTRFAGNVMEREEVIVNAIPLRVNYIPAPARPYDNWEFSNNLKITFASLQGGLGLSEVTMLTNIMQWSYTTLPDGITLIISDTLETPNELTGDNGPSDPSVLFNPVTDLQVTRDDDEVFPMLLGVGTGVSLIVLGLVSLVKQAQQQAWRKFVEGYIADWVQRNEVLAKVLKQQRAIITQIETDPAFQGIREVLQQWKLEKNLYESHGEKFLRQGFVHIDNYGNFRFVQYDPNNPLFYVNLETIKERLDASIAGIENFNQIISARGKRVNRRMVMPVKWNDQDSPWIINFDKPEIQQWATRHNFILNPNNPPDPRTLTPDQLKDMPDFLVQPLTIQEYSKYNPFYDDVHWIDDNGKDRTTPGCFWKAVDVELNDQMIVSVMEGFMGAKPRNLAVVKYLGPLNKRLYNYPFEMQAAFRKIGYPYYAGISHDLTKYCIEAKKAGFMDDNLIADLKSGKIVNTRIYAPAGADWVAEFSQQYHGQKMDIWYDTTRGVVRPCAMAFDMDWMTNMFKAMPNGYQNGLDVFYNVRDALVQLNVLFNDLRDSKNPFIQSITEPAQQTDHRLWKDGTIMFKLLQETAKLKQTLEVTSKIGAGEVRIGDLWVKVDPNIKILYGTGSLQTAKADESCPMNAHWTKFVETLRLLGSDVKTRTDRTVFESVQSVQERYDPLSAPSKAVVLGGDSLLAKFSEICANLKNYLDLNLNVNNARSTKLTIPYETHQKRVRCFPELLEANVRAMIASILSQYAGLRYYLIKKVGGKTYYGLTYTIDFSKFFAPFEGMDAINAQRYKANPDLPLIHNIFEYIFSTLKEVDPKMDADYVLFRLMRMGPLEGENNGWILPKRGGDFFDNFLTKVKQHTSFDIDLRDVTKFCAKVNGITVRPSSQEIRGPTFEREYWRLMEETLGLPVHREPYEPVIASNKYGNVIYCDDSPINFIFVPKSGTTPAHWVILYNQEVVAWDRAKLDEPLSTNPTPHQYKPGEMYQRIILTNDLGEITGLEMADRYYGADFKRNFNDHGDYQGGKEGYQSAVGLAIQKIRQAERIARETKADIGTEIKNIAKQAQDTVSAIRNAPSFLRSFLYGLGIVPVDQGDVQALVSMDIHAPGSRIAADVAGGLAPREVALVNDLLAKGWNPSKPLPSSFIKESQNWAEVDDYATIQAYLQSRGIGSTDDYLIAQYTQAMAEVIAEGFTGMAEISDEVWAKMAENLPDFFTGQNNNQAELKEQIRNQVESHLKAKYGVVDQALATGITVLLMTKALLDKLNMAAKVNTPESWIAFALQGASSAAFITMQVIKLRSVSAMASSAVGISAAKSAINLRRFIPGSTWAFEELYMGLLMDVITDAIDSYAYWATLTQSGYTFDEAVSDAIYRFLPPILIEAAVDFSVAAILTAYAAWQGGSVAAALVSTSSTIGLAIGIVIGIVTNLIWNAIIEQQNAQCVNDVTMWFDSEHQSLHWSSALVKHGGLQVGDEIFYGTLWKNNGSNSVWYHQAAAVAPPAMDSRREFPTSWNQVKSYSLSRIIYQKVNTWENYWSVEDRHDSTLMGQFEDIMTTQWLEERVRLDAYHSVARSDLVQWPDSPTSWWATGIAGSKYGFWGVPNGETGETKDWGRYWPDESLPGADDDGDGVIEGADWDFFAYKLPALYATPELHLYVESELDYFWHHVSPPSQRVNGSHSIQDITLGDLNGDGCIDPALERPVRVLEPTLVQFFAHCSPVPQDLLAQKFADLQENFTLYQESHSWREAALVAQELISLSNHEVDMQEADLTALEERLIKPAPGNTYTYLDPVIGEAGKWITAALPSTLSSRFYLLQTNSIEEWNSYLGATGSIALWDAGWRALNPRLGMLYAQPFGDIETTTVPSDWCVSAGDAACKAMVEQGQLMLEDKSESRAVAVSKNLGALYEGSIAWQMKMQWDIPESMYGLFSCAPHARWEYQAESAFYASVVHHVPGGGMVDLVTVETRWTLDGIGRIWCNGVNIGSFNAHTFANKFDPIFSSPQEFRAESETLSFRLDVDARSSQAHVYLNGEFCTTVSFTAQVVPDGIRVRTDSRLGGGWGNGNWGFVDNVNVTCHDWHGANLNGWSSTDPKGLLLVPKAWLAQQQSLLKINEDYDAKLAGLPLQTSVGVTCSWGSSVPVLEAGGIFKGILDFNINGPDNPIVQYSMMGMEDFDVTPRWGSAPLQFLTQVPISIEVPATMLPGTYSLILNVSVLAWAEKPWVVGNTTLFMALPFRVRYNESLTLDIFGLPETVDFNTTYSWGMLQNPGSVPMSVYIAGDELPLGMAAYADGEVPLARWDFSNITSGIFATSGASCLITPFPTELALSCGSGGVFVKNLSLALQPSDYVRIQCRHSFSTPPVLSMGESFPLGGASNTLKEFTFPLQTFHALQNYTFTCEGSGTLWVDSIEIVRPITRHAPLISCTFPGTSPWVEQYGWDAIFAGDEEYIDVPVSITSAGFVDASAPDTCGDASGELAYLKVGGNANFATYVEIPALPPELVGLENFSRIERYLYMKPTVIPTDPLSEDLRVFECGEFSEGNLTWTSAPTASPSWWWLCNATVPDNRGDWWVWDISSAASKYLCINTTAPGTWVFASDVNGGLNQPFVKYVLHKSGATGGALVMQSIASKQVPESFTLNYSTSQHATNITLQSGDKLWLALNNPFATTIDLFGENRATPISSFSVAPQVDDPQTYLLHEFRVDAAFNLSAITVRSVTSLNASFHLGYLGLMRFLPNGASFSAINATGFYAQTIPLHSPAVQGYDAVFTSPFTGGLDGFEGNPEDSLLSEHGCLIFNLSKVENVTASKPISFAINTGDLARLRYHALGESISVQVILQSSTSSTILIDVCNAPTNKWVEAVFNITTDVEDVTSIEIFVQGSEALVEVDYIIIETPVPVSLENIYGGHREVLLLQGGGGNLASTGINFDTALASGQFDFWIYVPGTNDTLVWTFLDLAGMELQITLTNWTMMLGNGTSTFTLPCVMNGWEQFSLIWDGTSYARNYTLLRGNQTIVSGNLLLPPTMNSIKSVRFSTVASQRQFAIDALCLSSGEGYQPMMNLPMQVISGFGQSITLQPGETYNLTLVGPARNYATQPGSYPIFAAVYDAWTGQVLGLISQTVDVPAFYDMAFKNMTLADKNVDIDIGQELNFEILLRLQNYGNVRQVFTLDIVGLRGDAHYWFEGTGVTGTPDTSYSVTIDPGTTTDVWFRVENIGYNTHIMYLTATSPHNSSSIPCYICSNYPPEWISRPPGEIAYLVDAAMPPGTFVLQYEWQDYTITPGLATYSLSCSNVTILNETWEPIAPEYRAGFTWDVSTLPVGEYVYKCTITDGRREFLSNETTVFVYNDVPQINHPLDIAIEVNRTRPINLDWRIFDQQAVDPRYNLTIDGMPFVTNLPWTWNASTIVGNITIDLSSLPLLPRTTPYVFTVTAWDGDIETAVMDSVSVTFYNERPTIDISPPPNYLVEWGSLITLYWSVEDDSWTSDATWALFRNGSQIDGGAFTGALNLMHVQESSELAAYVFYEYDLIIFDGYVLDNSCESRAVIFLGNHPPTIVDHPAHLEFEFGQHDTAHLYWTIQDASVQNPTYQVFVSTGGGPFVPYDHPSATGSWVPGSTIKVGLTSMGVGLFIFGIRLNDGVGGIRFETEYEYWCEVQVTNDLPVVTILAIPEEFDCHTGPHELRFLITDDSVNPAGGVYTIKCNGQTYASGTWTGPTSMLTWDISFGNPALGSPIDELGWQYLAVGSYKFVIEADDSLDEQAVQVLAGTVAVENVAPMILRNQPATNAYMRNGVRIVLGWTIVDYSRTAGMKIMLECRRVFPNPIGLESSYEIVPALGTTNAFAFAISHDFGMLGNAPEDWPDNIAGVLYPTTYAFTIIVNDGYDMPNSVTTLESTVNFQGDDFIGDYDVIDGYANDNGRAGWATHAEAQVYQAGGSLQFKTSPGMNWASPDRNSLQASAPYAVTHLPPSTTWTVYGTLDDASIVDQYVNTHGGMILLGQHSNQGPGGRPDVVFWGPYRAWDGQRTLVLGYIRCMVDSREPSKIFFNSGSFYSGGVVATGWDISHLAIRKTASGYDFLYQQSSGTWQIAYSLSNSWFDTLYLSQYESLLPFFGEVPWVGFFGRNFGTWPFAGDWTLKVDAITWG